MEKDGWKNNKLTDEQIAAKLSGTLTNLVRNPDKKDRYAHIIDKDGHWIVRDDVWVYYNRGSTAGLKKGDLTVGFGANDGKIGPEFGFGHVLGQAMNEQVLLIKTCWGGKSLAFDFRPPSAGKSDFEVKPRKDGTIPKPGEYYALMMTEVKEVVGNLKKYFPNYDGRGYEIAGFFWHQGWNDGCNQAFAEEYAKNMQWFIKDVRKDLGVKDLPFVIANSGFGGTAKGGGVIGRLQALVQPAQKAAEELPHVTCVDTRPFYRAPEQSPGGGDIEHWFSNAESYFLIGDASGKAMLQLLGKKPLAAR